MKQLLSILMLACLSIKGHAATYANNYTTNARPNVINVGGSNYISSTNFIVSFDNRVPTRLIGTVEMSSAGTANGFTATSYGSGIFGCDMVFIDGINNFAIGSDTGSIIGTGNGLLFTRNSTNESSHGAVILGGKYNGIRSDGGDTAGEDTGLLVTEYSLLFGDHSQSVILGGFRNIIGSGGGGGGNVVVIGASNQLVQATPANIVALGYGLRTTNSPSAAYDAGNSYAGAVVEIGVDFNKRLRIENTNIWLFGLTLNTPTLLNSTLLGTNYAETLIPTNTYFGTAYFSNGYASFSTASATIAATGWTNIWSTNNAMVRVTATATTITVKQRDDSTLDTLTTFSGTVYIPLQPGQAITAASGLAGKAVAQ